MIVDGPSWTEAESASASLGGHLAAINDSSENNWIYETYGKYGEFNNGLGLMIGMTDEGQEGVFRWTNGDAVTYTNWDGYGNPDNSRGLENYVVLLGGRGNGRWNDFQEDWWTLPGVSTRRDEVVGLAEIPLSYFTISDLTVTEGESGTVTISRTGGTKSTQNITLKSSDGSAKAGDDYDSIYASIHFGVDEITKSIFISPKIDQLTEASESFNLQLIASATDVVPAQLGTKNTAKVWIVDKQPQPQVVNNVVQNTTNISNTTNIINNHNEGIYHGDVNNNNVHIGDNNTLGDVNVNAGSGSTNTGEWTGKIFFELPSSATISDITKQWFGSTNTARTKAQTLDINTDPQLLDVATKTWSKKVKVNKIVQASNNGDTIRAEAPEKFVPAIGSVLNGGQARDIVEGRIGWDIIDGGNGSDFIHGGNGRDVITGGAGGDELWGDFGLNTFKSEKDGQKDLVVIKSDHYVYNWLNNSYTNNPNGERTDFIEGLDSWDRIRVTGGYKQDLRFAENVTHMGQTGIAIYLKDSLEALYTGNDLSLDQIRNMTDGDGSETAILNQTHQYGLGWW